MVYKKWLYGSAIVAALAIVIWLTFYNVPGSVEAPGRQKSEQKYRNSAGMFDKQQFPINVPGSIWWVVSKARPLEPATYAPANLRVPAIPLRINAGDSEMRLDGMAATALESMVVAATHDDAQLMLASGYRSYQLQVAIYNANLQKYGQAGADQQSDRPGTSEHQTGLAADLEPVSKQCEFQQCFGELPEGTWLAANAYKYGFMLRYPLSKETITGYDYEPWHIRYIGKDLATELHEQNITTLEEFFNVLPDKQPH